MKLTLSNTELLELLTEALNRSGFDNIDDMSVDLGDDAVFSLADIKGLVVNLKAK